MESENAGTPGAGPLALHRIEARAPTENRAATPLLLAHGFTQNHRCWGTFAMKLAADATTDAIDLPGHGGSGHDDVDLREAGRLLSQACAGHVIVGYSMGGRIALHAALDSSASLRGLVVIGATPGMRDADDRAERRVRDRRLADDLDRDPGAFVDRWLSLPMFAGLGPAVQFRAERLANRTAGMSATLRHRGTGSQQPLHEALGEVDIPVLALVGEHDAKFRAEAKDLQDAMGGSTTVAIVQGAGHACHLERPDAAASEVIEWLRRPDV